MEVEALASAHVDDNGIMASEPWLRWAYQEFMKKFGDVTRQTLPLRHCGIDHERFPTQEFINGPRVGDSMILHQQEFTGKLLVPLTLTQK